MIYTVPTFDQHFRLKNVASGCFLCIINMENGPDLGLTYDGTDSCCLFQMRPKIPSDGTDDKIQYNEIVKLTSAMNPQYILLALMDEVTNTGQVHAIGKSNLDKQLRTQTLFDVRAASKELTQIADRISSLFPYLLEFHVFLQNWGLVFKRNRIEYT